MASEAKILKSIQHFDNVGKEIERFEERIRDAIAEPDCSAALIDVLKSKIEKYEKKLEETFSELNIDVGDEKWGKYLDMQDSLLNCSVSLEKIIVTKSVRNLTVLGLEINQLSELIIINHCTSKLHEEIAHRWELTLKPDTYPTLQAFRMFIESEARALGLLSGNADAPKSKLGTSNQIINKSYAESRKNVGSVGRNAYFPIIIPKHHPITTLVIRHFHLRGFHSGTQMTLSLIRQHYWIPDERSTVRREIKRCIVCCRFNSKPSYPKMGDLPKQRITQTRPFEIVGIDFAGPILTKCQHLRKANKFKSYICLFICLATKAVHLELVSFIN
ncbi:integrase catalytic domain-containing protein [Trichonephila clavipes]|nr:integrase catalytic domain-containing protein [Trichonephila clavipes]